MENKYIIVDIGSQEFFKTVAGDVMVFADYESALQHCGIYELSNAWICRLEYNYREKI